MWNWKKNIVEHYSSQRMNRVLNLWVMTCTKKKKKCHGKIIQQFPMISHNTLIYTMIMGNLHKFFTIFTCFTKEWRGITKVHVQKNVVFQWYHSFWSYMIFASNWRWFHKVKVIYGMSTPKLNPLNTPSPTAQYCIGAFHFKLEVPASNLRYKNMGAPLSKVLSHS